LAARAADLESVVPGLAASVEATRRTLDALTGRIHAAMDLADDRVAV
jgi:hypothetical protein